MFDNQIKEVTLYDYFNNLFNYDLIKLGESHNCSNCKKITLADKFYKMLELPNALILTLSFKGQENSNYLKLTNFIMLDFKDFVEEVYINKAKTTFQNEKVNFRYNLKSVIIYSNRGGPCHEGYVTYVKDEKRKGWLKFSRYDIELVGIDEIEIVHFPYILIYEREFGQGGSERHNLLS
jgi:ubiquitin C-terminal hydrolase